MISAALVAWDRVASRLYLFVRRAVMFDIRRGCSAVPVQMNCR